MNTLVVYDSVHGNTKAVAEAIADAIGEGTPVRQVSAIGSSELEAADLLVIGAPTHGGRPSPRMLEFLGKLSDSVLSKARVAAFDTRIPARWVKIFGYAAPKTAGALKKRGATIVGQPEGFFVKGTEGPLLDGELERATAWAKGILKSS